MRAVVQRVSTASVVVDGETVGRIGQGLLVLVCAMEGDTDADVAWLCQKLPALRIFPDDAGRMNKALLDLPAGSRGLLVVSQFTLSASLLPGLSRGNRPAFTAAMAPGPASAMVDTVMARLGAAGCEVQGGRFGAHMAVSLTNDGPVTLWLDTRSAKAGGTEGDIP